MKHEEIDTLLKSNPIFSSLDDASREQLISHIMVVELNENEILFHQGDPAKNIYLLARGILASIIVNALGETRILGQINEGEIVGEMGVLSNEPRSLSVKALTHATLLKINKDIFLDVAQQNPSILFAVMNPIISRSVGLLNMLAMEKKNKTIVILPANEETDFQNFSDALRKIAEKYPSTLFIPEDHPDFIDKNLSTEIIREKIREITDKNKPVHRICYLLHSHETTLAKVALKRAGAVYIVADANPSPKLFPRLRDIIDHSSIPLPSLVLIHPQGTKRPEHSDKWLALANFKLLHHLRMENSKDFERLLRFIRGKAVGVVLSGGGTRGWAHIGAIKAIREARIPIDIIGGASVGALVAALYGLNQSWKEAYEKFQKLILDSRHSVSWRSFTWPIVSLFNASHFTKALKDIFGKTRMEELWLPYFCITSNMATNAEEVHQQGLLWEVIRASASIPGIMPPMLLKGELHFDGSILNTLPTDVMRNMIGQKGRLIAIELNTLSPDTHTYQFPPVLTLKDALLSKLKIRQYKFPSFIDIFMRSIFLNSRIKGKNNALLATMHVNLDLSQFKLLRSNLKEGETLMQMGYEETLKQIQRMKDRNVGLI